MLTPEEALDRLYVAGHISSPSLPGMLYTAGPLDTVRRVESGWSWCSGAWSPGDLPLGKKLVLTDHATVGCLRALLREARNDPGLIIERRSNGTWRCFSADPWPTPMRGRHSPSATTEAGAIVQCLILLAEAL